MDSITRIKEFIRDNFPDWTKVDFSTIDDNINFREDWSDLYKINNEEIILISYTNISITGTDRLKPQLRVFLDEYKKPFLYAKKHNLRFYLFSIFTKEDEMARGLDNFNPKEYIISIETNLDTEGSRRDLRSIYDYANEKLNGRKFLKCSHINYKADINQASFIYIGTPEAPEKETFESFINIFDSRPYLNSKIDISPIQRDVQPLSLEDTSYLPYLTALRTKPFMLLAGMSGTGKSRIVRELAFKSCPSYLQDEDGTTPGNYCMIEVKPNWHDSSELLGYYSNIAKNYQFTKFVKFLVKAIMFPKVPFFVCMDEMNLAPVEQYFAEFLSVLETRKKVNEIVQSGTLVDSKYFSEYGLTGCKNNGEVYMKLHETGLDNIKTKESESKSLIEKGLTLPENVFVIGTVNMDDTTHQFSRKVLDRAMTIEMNGGELKDMFGHSSDLEYLPEEKVWKIDQFKPKHVNADEVLEDHPAEEDALKTQLADKLDAINQVLKDTPFVVSYRVLNELVIYAGVLLDDGKETEEAINDAVDQITLMKILPRIEGDEDLLGNAKDENNRLCQLMKVVGPNSQAKIKEMNRRLESGFTRFWP